jgi:pilus assembly protein CpaC
MTSPSRYKRPASWASVLLAGVCLSLAPIGLAGQGQSAGQATQGTPPPQTVEPPTSVSVAPLPQTPDKIEKINLLAGRSMVLTSQVDIEKIAITDPDVADALVVAPREVLVNGKKPGTISLILWGQGQRVHYELVIEPGVTTLEQRLHNLFPGEDISVSVSDGAVILSGSASNNDVMLRAGEIAQASSPTLKVINMLQLPGGPGSQQVMLQVRFAEVNHKAVEELGANLFTTRTGFTARATTQQFSAPDFNDVGDVGGLVFSDFLNLFFFQRNQGIGGVVKALQQSGNFESLAEPNLIAYNGKEASFLAGGEFPVPVVSGTTGNVSITFREFGVRLKFTPTIAGDVIRLHLRPEVSSLDFNNGITLSGFRIPALTTRYADTEVELRDGQSFAIAGLLDNVAQEDRSAIPILSQIPIIGNIFKSRAKRSERTELMVLITPRLVRPLNPDEVPPLPTIIKPPAKGGRGGGGGDVGSRIQGGAGLMDAPPSKPGGGGLTSLR